MEPYLNDFGMPVTLAYQMTMQLFEMLAKAGLASAACLSILVVGLIAAGCWQTVHDVRKHGLTSQ